MNILNVTHNVHMVLKNSSSDPCPGENSHGNTTHNCDIINQTSEHECRETFNRITIEQTTTLEESESKFYVTTESSEHVLSETVLSPVMAQVTSATSALSTYFHSIGGNVKNFSILMLFIYIFHRTFTHMLLYPIFRLLFGTLYPAYASYKAVKSKNVKEYVKWMMYWIVFALFTCAETITDVFLSWFPFYYEIKIILVIWLLSPATKGSSFLYRKFVHPMLSSREQEIDDYISKAKEQSYKQVLDIGQKGVNALMQTALKGGGGLVNQIRKSYSLSDLTDSRHSDDAISDIDDVPLRKRSPSKKQRPSGISTSMYFSEIDVRTEGITSMASAEDISSGYSSNETLLQLAGQSTPKSQREILARGASLKARPTRVTRAGAAVGAAAVAKKPATTDGRHSDDVIFVNGKPERLATIPSLSPSPQTSQSSSDNEFMDTFNDSEEESTIREIPKIQRHLQGNCDAEESNKEPDQSQPDSTNTSNNQKLKDTQELPAPDLKQSQDIKESDILEMPSDVHNAETPKEMEAKQSEVTESDGVNIPSIKPSMDIPPRRGKYHKKTAPTPPKPRVIDKKILDHNQVGAITATLVLQPGIIKPLAEGEEVFCYSPKMRRRNKSRSRSKSPSPSPKLYRKLFNKSPNLGKKDIKDPSESPMAKLMGLFKHEEKEKEKRSSWHGSSVGERDEGH